ncbi:MAG: hypothetical protein IKB19_04230 [Rikenellaceae bacterium]|nr:hypothetical protein [Rikenellaceae bacterium]
MSFFALLFLTIIAWYAYKMFRDIFRGGAGVGRGSRELPQEGDVTVHQTVRQPRKRVNDNVGEYVDFKEVKDKSRK